MASSSSRQCAMPSKESVAVGFRRKYDMICFTISAALPASSTYSAHTGVQERSEQAVVQTRFRVATAVYEDLWRFFVPGWVKRDPPKDHHPTGEQALDRETWRHGWRRKEVG